MIFTKVYDGDVTVIRPGVERLTAVNAKVFKEETIELIEAGASRLVMDFSQTTFLDSSGLGALAGVLKKIGLRGDLVVCGLNSDVQQLFRICRMDRVFRIYPDVSAALLSLSENG